MIFLITLICGQYIYTLCYPFPRTLNGVVLSQYKNYNNVVSVFDYNLPLVHPSSTSHRAIRNFNTLTTFKKRSMNFLSKATVIFRNIFQPDWVNIIGRIIGFLGIQVFFINFISN